jgi:hypothetical protein
MLFWSLSIQVDHKRSKRYVLHILILHMKSVTRQRKSNKCMLKPHLWVKKWRILVWENIFIYYNCKHVFPLRVGNANCDKLERFVLMTNLFLWSFYVFFFVDNWHKLFGVFFSIPRFLSCWLQVTLLLRLQLRFLIIIIFGVFVGFMGFWKGVFLLLSKDTDIHDVKL